MNKIKICDDLWALLVKQRASYQCERCGREIGLQAHHIIPRTNYSLRHDPANGVCLCVKHHLYWAHKDATNFSEWISTIRDMEYLNTRRHTKGKNDYEVIRLKLIQELNGGTVKGM